MSDLLPPLLLPVAKPHAYEKLAGSPKHGWLLPTMLSRYPWQPGHCQSPLIMVAGYSVGGVLVYLYHASAPPPPSQDSAVSLSLFCFLCLLALPVCGWSLLLCSGALFNRK